VYRVIDVGRPILAAAGFQPALATSGDAFLVEKPPGKAAAGNIARPTIQASAAVV